MRNRIKTVAVAAVVSALTVAGLAVAQNDDGNGDGQGNDGKRVVKRFHGPPPGGPGGPTMLAGPGGGKLTYSETHLRRDGEDVVVRADKGEVTAASDDSISIERNDGETVEVAVDGDTKVLAGPGKDDATAGDIADGKQVVVIREDGDEAEAIMVEPSRKDRLEFRRHLGGPPPGGDMPPPPGFDGGQD